MTTNDQLTTVSPAHAGSAAPTVAQDPWAETADKPTTATEVITAPKDDTLTDLPPRDDTAILTPMAASPFPATSAFPTTAFPAGSEMAGTERASTEKASTEKAGSEATKIPEMPAKAATTAEGTAVGGTTGAAAAAITSSVPAAAGTPVEAPAAGLPGVGSLPPVGPPPGQWQVPPPAAGRPRITKSPKLILIAAVLVTAIASSGITAGIMSALGGSTPAVATQDGTTQQGGPGGGFGGGPGGGGMQGGGGFGGGPGGMQQDSSGTQQGAQQGTQQGTDQGTQQQGTQPDSGTQQQGTTGQQSTTGT